MTTRFEDLDFTVFDCENHCGDPITYAEREGYPPTWLHVSLPTNAHGPIKFIHCAGKGGGAVATPLPGGAAIRYQDRVDRQIEARTLISNVTLADGAEADEVQPFLVPMSELGIQTIERPSHYGIRLGGATYDVIDVIEALGLDFHTGNALKYIVRAGRKDVAATIEDYEKARYYLSRRIEYLDGLDLEADGK